MKTFSMAILIDIILFSLSDHEAYKKIKTKQSLLLIISLIEYFFFTKHIQFSFLLEIKWVTITEHLLSNHQQYLFF